MYRGELTVWKDERGFGFIRPINGGQEVFLHITALTNGSRRPKIGDVICYQLTTNKDGKVRACNAFIEEATVKPASRAFSSKTRATSEPAVESLSLLLEVLLLAFLPAIGSIHLLATTANPIPLILYPVMSLLTFALYNDDKIRASERRWRVSERTLHICELLGGWLGGFIAQRKLRHKSRKVSYQVVFWLIVAMHIVFWLDWLFFGQNFASLFLNVNS